MTMLAGAAAVGSLPNPSETVLLLDYKYVLWESLPDCAESAPTHVCGETGSGRTTLAKLLGWNMDNVVTIPGSWDIDLEVKKNVLFIVRRKSTTTASDRVYQNVSVKFKGVMYRLSGKGSVIPGTRSEDQKEEEEATTHCFEPCFSIGLHVKDNGVIPSFFLVRIPEVNTSAPIPTALVQKMIPRAEQVGELWEPMKKHYLPSNECLDLYRNACIKQLDALIASSINWCKGKRRMPFAQVPITCPINVQPLDQDDLQRCVKAAKDYIFQTIGEDLVQDGFKVKIKMSKSSNSTSNLLRNGQWCGTIVISCAN